MVRFFLMWELGLMKIWWEILMVRVMECWSMDGVWELWFDDLVGDEEVSEIKVVCEWISYSLG